MRRLSVSLFSFCLLFTCFLSFFSFFFLMSFTSSAFFNLFSGLLWLLLCVISHVSHALCISRYLMPPLSSLPFVGFFSVRASCNFTQFIQNPMGFFFALACPLFILLIQYFILFYFNCLCLCVCVCAVIESHFNGRRFSRQFSLCRSWGQFWGQQLAARSLNVFITPNEWKLSGTRSCCVPLPFSFSTLSLPPFCHKIISLVKIFHSHLCFYFAALPFFCL